MKTSEDRAIRRTKKLWEFIEDELNTTKEEYPGFYDTDYSDITQMKGVMFEQAFGDLYAPKPVHNCFLCEHARYSQPREDGVKFRFGKTCRYCVYYKKHGHLCTALGYNEDYFNEQVIEELLFFCDTIKNL